MGRISSLIVDGTESLTEKTVPQVHNSVVDYLVSNRPNQDLRIDPTEHHQSLTTSFFEIIHKPTFNADHITTSYQLDKEIPSISEGITYPCQWLIHHLMNGGESATLVSDVEKFMKTHFLQWLEVLSVNGDVDSFAVNMLVVLLEEVAAVEQIEVSTCLFTKYGY